MKSVRATIDARKLYLLKERLRQLGATGLTIDGVLEFGRGQGLSVGYHGAVLTVDFVPRVALEVVISDSLVAEVVEAIRATARASCDGDGEISVATVEAAIRIRTGERGDAAL